MLQAGTGLTTARRGRGDFVKAVSSPASTKSNVVAFAFSALVMLMPANLLPVMRMTIVGQAPSEPTIFGGIVLLWQQGLWPLGLIVFTASILVPIFKLAGLGWLLWSARRRRSGE